jgi:hypothetical protein
MSKIYEDRITNVRQLKSVKCDRCEREFDDALELQEFHTIDFIGGYSSVFGDDTSVECDICQYCLKELIGDFCRVDEGGAR